MTAAPLRWQDVFTPGARVLLIVNSAAVQREEIERAIDALASTAGLANVSCIASSSLRSWLIGRGIESRAILVPRVAGLELEFGEFLQRPLAIEWAVNRRARVVLGTEPYPPRNEDAKVDFERRVAPMLGGAQYVVHSLPRNDVFVLGPEDLWNRASLFEAKAMHQARVTSALDALHAHWSASPNATAPAILAETLGAATRPSDDAMPRVAARAYAMERLWAAIRDAARTDPRMPRLFIEPAGIRPATGLLPTALHQVRRPAQIGKGVRTHGTRLAIRGAVEGPYSYLLMSRPATLKRGDAVLAEGRVYRGGVTIGLVKGDAWAARVDIDAPGPFLAAAVATEPGEHRLVIANCLKGDDRSNAVVLHRFGWAHA